MKHDYFLVTGGSLARDLAQFQLARSEYCGYLFDCVTSGPIDAPDIMPAGAMNSADAKDWKGNVVVCQSIAIR